MSAIHRPSSHLLFTAVPAIAASIAVLAFAAVGRNTWIVQAIAIVLACAIAVAGARVGGRTRIRFPAGALVCLTLLGIAIPLLSRSSGPHRWVALGPVNLYMASVLLPAFLLACSVWIARRGRFERLALAAIAGAGVLLAAQPDAPQALALFVAATFVVARSSSRSPASILTLIVVALTTAWAFSQPDPLHPIPHVEGVFALALSQSLFAGVAVIACAAALVIGRHVMSSGGRTWLSAIAAYYAVLFACSGAGMTPAPLIGYGAGPWLGFGLMVAAACAVERTAGQRPA